jgi:hypothetical protein
MKKEVLADILEKHDLWLRNGSGERADLRNADLRDADLRNADLRDADLRNADLRDANLRDANLRNADVDGVILSPYKVCPEIGEFIAWKKLRDKRIAKVLIPDDAKRMNSIGSRKCRTNSLKILEIFDVDSGVRYDSGKCWSLDINYTYVVGEWFYEPYYNEDIRQECVAGLHFFMTLEEAKQWR